MRKLITLVAVLFFLGMVAQAQVTPVEIPISFTVNVVEALYFDITPTVVNWTVPLSTDSGVWIPQDGAPLDYTVSYRLADGDELKLLVDNNALEFDYGDGTLLPYSMYLKQVWTGDIMVDENVTGGNFYGSGDTIGMKEGQLQFEFWNDSTVKVGTATGTLMFMAYAGI